MEYRLQSIHNDIVGRTASVVSPFYSILLGFIIFTISLKNQETKEFKIVIEISCFVGIPVHALVFFR